MALISSTSSGIGWITFGCLTLCLTFLAIAATIVLSLITVFLPDHGAGLNQSQTCQISFAPMVRLATGAGPSFMATADFNNDGYLDLAVANFADSTTSIFLGNGNGSFSQQTTLSNGVGSTPNLVVAGDVNNDNTVDLVVANGENNNVGIFLGQDNGDFSEQTTLLTGTDSIAVALELGDLNKDNILDLIVLDYKISRILVFLGVGDGTFVQTLTLSTGTNSGPYSIVIKDFNKDTYLDAVVGNSNASNIGVFLGDGTGNLKEQVTYATGAMPVSLVAADFNRDGTLDIATANFADNSTSVLLGNGDGTFAERRTFSTGSGSTPYGIDSGDFNRDNKLDLIVANAGANNIGVLLGYGNGNFRQIKTYSTGDNTYPNAIIFGDFNRDNRLDILSANYDDNSTGIFLSTCL